MISMVDALKDDLLSMIGERVVTAATLSAKIGRSERTVYRLIGLLKRDGHPIMSEPGVGYVIWQRDVRRVERVRDERLRLAGTHLANLAYNIDQKGAADPDDIAALKAAQVEWEKALAESAVEYRQ